MIFQGAIVSDIFVGGDYPGLIVSGRFSGYQTELDLKVKTWKIDHIFEWRNKKIRYKSWLFQAGWCLFSSCIYTEDELTI